MTESKNAPKSAVKTAQSKQAENQSATKEKAEKKAASRKEELAADFPVTRSGLDSVPSDVLNPAFSNPEVIEKVQQEIQDERDEQADED